MSKTLKQILSRDILHIYPKNMKQTDKYDEIGHLWFLIPIYILLDLLSVLFKIGDKESRARKIFKLRRNLIAILLYLVLVIVTVLLILKST